MTDNEARLYYENRIREHIQSVAKWDARFERQRRIDLIAIGMGLFAVVLNIAVLVWSMMG